jgi:excisionase family DNA binding protein
MSSVSLSRQLKTQKAIEEDLLTLAQASELLNVSKQTIYNWVHSNKIDYIDLPNGRRRYHIKDIKNKNLPDNKEEKSRHGIIYARVSTRKQSVDLQRQIDFLREQYPEYQLIKDIGSGINYKKRGLQTLVGLVVSGKVLEVVVANKDRLCRFGFELLEQIFELHGTKIVVLNNKECSKEQELVQDLLSIVTVFSCGNNGIGKYKQRIRDDPDFQEEKEVQEKDECC